jgi:flagellar biosynthesis protein FlhA
VESAPIFTIGTRALFLRHQITSETGLVVPSVHIIRQPPARTADVHDSLEWRRGRTRRALSGSSPCDHPGNRGVEPRRHRYARAGVRACAIWISTEQRDRASAAGYTGVDPTTALSSPLSEIIRNFLPDLLTPQQTKEMVDGVAQT